MGGRVTAGQPILAQENIENTFSLPKEMVPDAEVFMLSVKGNSMIDAGILNGDYILSRSKIQQKTQRYCRLF